MITVSQLESDGCLLVQDGNHGEYRPRPHEFEDEGTAFIRATELSDGRVDFAGAGRINDVARQRLRKGIGAPGDVLFSHKGTVGKLARVPLDAPEFVCSPQTTFWRTLDESRLRRDFLYCFMRSKPFIEQWWVRKGETDMADYVSLTAQRQLRVMVPPVDIQARIAEPITAIDDLIENNRRRVEVLEEMARAIYREWFVHFRFPGHETATFVDSDLGPIPDGWSVQAVSKAVELKPRLRLDRDKQHPFVTMGDVSETGLWCEPSERKAGTSGAKFQNWDTLFARITPCLENGKTALVVCLDGQEVGRGSTELITLRGRSVGPVFTYCLARSDELRGHAIASMSGASGRQRVRDECFDSFFLAVPPAELSRDFELRTRPMIEMVRDLSRAAKRLASLRDRLLPKLVTGQIDVSDLDLDAVVEGV